MLFFYSEPLFMLFLLIRVSFCLLFAWIIFLHPLRQFRCNSLVSFLAKFLLSALHKAVTFCCYHIVSWLSCSCVCLIHSSVSHLGDESSVTSLLSPSTYILGFNNCFWMNVWKCLVQISPFLDEENEVFENSVIFLRLLY